MSTHAASQNAAQTPIRAALAAALPIMAGYVVLGLPCGILASTAGMQAWMVAVMSLVFYSGAGQYMIPNMWLAGSPVGAIVASVGLVNTRQMLYGASLSRFCGEAGPGLAALFGATVTDESFGVNYARFTEGGWTVRQALLVNLFSLATWTASNVAGALVGAAVAVPASLASFAMTSLFICLLCMQDLRGEGAVAAVAAALAVAACKLAGISGAAILVGALAGIAAALMLGPVFEPRKAHAAATAEDAPAAKGADAQNRPGPGSDGLQDAPGRDEKNGGRTCR